MSSTPTRRNTSTSTKRARSNIWPTDWVDGDQDACFGYNPSGTPRPIGREIVAITASCPECQTSYTLEEGLVGKQIRCPFCKQPFTVRAEATPPSALPSRSEPATTTTPARPRTDIPTSTYRSGSISDFVQVAGASAVPVGRLESTKSSPKTSPPPPRPEDFPWSEGPQTTSPSAPVEVKWSPDLDPLQPLQPIDLAPIDDDEPEPVRPRRDRDDSPPPRARKKGRKVLLFTMIGLIVVALGVGGYSLFRYLSLEPERLHAQGKKDYESNKYQQAKVNFDRVVSDHPSHRLAPESRFFSELSAVRQAVSSVLSKTDPGPAVAQWRAFLEVIKDEPFAAFAAKDRFGFDVWSAGGRVAEDVIEKSRSTYSQDDPAESEKWLGEASKIDTEIEQFRPDGVDRSDTNQKAIAELRAKIDGARARLVLLNEAKKRLASGTDAERKAAIDFARANGLANDPAFAAAIKDAEQKVRAKAGYFKEQQPKPPVATPDDGLTSLLFAPSVGPIELKTPVGPATVFFALARGVLYALAETDGHVLWATRTGLDSDVMPLRVASIGGGPEMALIPSNFGNSFGLTARATSDGRPIWHQSLPAPCRGVPVTVAGSAYVPLGDADGTILEIVVTTGEITGKLVLGRPVGPQIAVRPGTGLLYIPAEALATYVFDADARDQNGARKEPVLLGAIGTEHAPGSLRGTPVFSNPEPEDPGAKFLILAQADGLEAMKLRAFPISADGKPVGNDTAHEISLDGWASFPPYCDGEKLAVVTDKGQFGLFGLVLANNPDPPLFAFPSKSNKPPSNRPSRGQIVLADEGTFWVLVGGVVQKFRFGINPNEGVRLAAYGDPIPAGEPLHAPQVTHSGDMFVVVTQDGPACRATAVDARNGRTRWKRDLGAIAKGDPLMIGGSVLLLDQTGAMYRLDAGRLAEAGKSPWLLDENWKVFGPARPGFSPVGGLLEGPAESALAILISDAVPPKLAVRRFANGAVTEHVFDVPAIPAGRALVSGGFLILPLADGTLYRMAIAAPAGLEAGPTWRGERQAPSATCHLVQIDDDDLFASDGGRTIIRWRWDSRSKLFETRGRMVLPDRIATTPVVLPGNRLMIGDPKGNILMWDGDRLQPPAIKAWRPGQSKNLPLGTISDGLRLVRDADNQPRVVYITDGRIVYLSPNAEAPRWVGPEPIRAIEGQPLFMNQRIFMSDRAGIVRVIDAATGVETGESYRLTGSHALAASAVPLGNGRVVVPLADGTVVLGELSPPKK